MRICSTPSCSTETTNTQRCTKCNNAYQKHYRQANKAKLSLDRQRRIASKFCGICLSKSSGEQFSYKHAGTGQFWILLDTGWRRTIEAHYKKITFPQRPSRRTTPYRNTWSLVAESRDQEGSKALKAMLLEHLGQDITYHESLEWTDYPGYRLERDGCILTDYRVIYHEREYKYKLQRKNK